MSLIDTDKTAAQLVAELAEARAEIAELKRKVEQHREVIDQAGVGIIVGAADGTTTEYANPEFARLHGYARGELTGTPIALLFTPESRADIGPNIRLAHEKGRHVWESEHVRKDGSTFPVLIDVAVVKDEAGAVVRRVVCVQDLTERRRADAMRRESEARLREIVENSPVASYKRNLTTNEYEYVSPSFGGISGYSHDEMSRLPREHVLALMPADDRAAVERAVAQALAAPTGTAHQVHYRLMHKDGAYRWLADHFSVLRDALGRNLAIVGSVTDITDRKLSEVALKESEAKFSVVFKTSPNAISVTRLRDTRFLDVNDAFTTMTGYTREEALATTSPELGVMVDSEQRTRMVAALAEGGAVINREMSFRRKSGEFFTAMFSARIIEIGGEPCILSTTNDISERKRAEETLRHLSDRLHLALTSAKAGVWDWNLESDQMIWDDRMLELYGLTNETFPGGIAPWEQGLHPEDRARATEDVKAALRGEREFDTEFRVRRPDGRVGHIKANGLVLRDQAGKAVRMIGLNRDITDQKLAEEEWARLEAELHRAQKMESVGRLAGGVAHDFNNMLAVILGNAEAVLEHADPRSALREDVNEILNAAMRSSDLTRQLLTFARKQPVSPRVLELNEAVGGMLPLLRRLIGEDIEVAWRPGEGLWPLKVDPSQIDQTLTNLCVNARDAIPGVGKLTIETRNVTLEEDFCAVHGASPGDYVQLAVSDDGCGMTEETLPHIFEPFFSTKAAGAGTGLGLATVHGIVKQNNGFIDVHSEPGRGTTFRLYLPRHEVMAEPARADSMAAPATRGRETILLVEDEEAILRIAKRTLDGMGYTVLGASTPLAALRLAEAHAGEVHLLLSDVVMPEMNGRDLAKNLLSRRPNLKRLFMSGYTADVIAKNGILDEGVNFLQKPFSKADLAAKVREALDREALN